MKKKSSQKLLVIFSMAIFFAVLLGFFIKAEKPSTKAGFQPEIYLVNFAQNKKDIEGFQNDIQTAKKSGQTISKLHDILLKVLGNPTYQTNIDTLSYNDLTGKNTPPIWPVLPAAIRLATLCQQMQQAGDNSYNAGCQKSLNALSEKIDVAERLIKYYEILAGFPDLCVKADLGTQPHIKATAIDGATSQLYLCSGTEGDIKFRAPAKNDKFVRVQEVFTTDVSKTSEQKAESCVFATALTTTCDLTRE